MKKYTSDICCCDSLLKIFLLVFPFTGNILCNYFLFTLFVSLSAFESLHIINVLVDFCIT